MDQTTPKLEPTSQLTGRKRGRRHVPYRTSWHELVDGLARLPDGRWRINQTGQRFTEADERAAVGRFRKWEREQGKGVINVSVPIEKLFDGVKSIDDLAACDEMTRLMNWAAEAEFEFFGERPGQGEFDPTDIRRIGYGLPIPERILGPWLRRYILEHGDQAARLTGIPQLASIASLEIPGDSPTLEQLLDEYCDGSGVGRVTRRNARRTVSEFMSMTGVRTLRDITVAKLKDYRETMRKRYADETLDSVFGRIKTVVGYSRKEGVATTEVRAALDKLAVLHSGKKEGTTYDPIPIDPPTFRALLAGADAEMRAVLLLSLNCCLYLSEALAVEWREISFDKGTYQSRRGKTGVRRAAVLWSETVKAIRSLPRHAESPYMFTSSRGTKYAYGVNAYRDKFARLRKAVGVGPDVEYSHIRDGAYTTCCSVGVPLAQCRALAGHQLDGETDHYLARNPKMVKPACDAVYAEYAPFPASKPAVKVGRPPKAKAA